MDSPWLHKPTRTIRVPVVFADEALAFTRKLDRNETTDTVIETSDTEDERIKNLETELAEANAKLLRQYDTNRQLEREVSQLRSQLSAPGEPSKANDTDYNAFGIRDLKVMASAAKIKNYSYMTKTELIEELKKKRQQSALKQPSCATDTATS